MAGTVLAKCINLNKITNICRVKFFMYGGITIQKRFINLHEQFSFKLLSEAGVPVPPFEVANSRAEAGEKAKKLKTNKLVVKAQVLTGGRGKGSFKGGLKGGVKLVNSVEEAEKIAGQMIGDYLVTVQTGAKGILCNNVMITQQKPLEREFYLAIMMERKFGGPVIITSTQGGMDIEVLSSTNPNAIIYTPVDVAAGLLKPQAEEIAKKLGLTTQVDVAASVLQKLYNVFISKDATLIEINPFGIDKSGNIWCLDCKIKLDESAGFRQKALHALRDLSQEDAREIRAAKFGLNYVAMEGNIGCLVNGAGLAMATMDIIKYHGGIPANFLDVGGGATEQQVKEALLIITSDPNVMAIFVNIFGGIMRCDIIAQGIVLAVKELDLKVPIVCRLQGTNVDEGRIILGTAKVKILPVADLEDASRMAVKLAQIMILSTAARVKVNFELPL